MDDEFSETKALESVFAKLSSKGRSKSSIAKAVGELNIELVLTAHPTEIARRTLIHKYQEIDSCLDQLELAGRTDHELDVIKTRLRELITQIWHSQDFRQQRPTPIDEAKWGFTVIDNSLWNAVPQFMRRLNTALLASTGVQLPLDARLVSFSSWMGGDRDGNPNVTAAVTHEALLLSRWRAADLYLRDLNHLIEELSMPRCSEELRSLAGEAHEPYRSVLKTLRTKLENTLLYLEQALNGVPLENLDIISDAQQLWEPLWTCYESLISCGMHSIANAALLDTLRRVSAFGVHLVRLDIRQVSTVHAQLFSELTNFYQLGDYAQWSESDRQAFLYKELQSKRPLFSDDWQPSPQSQELLQQKCAHGAHLPVVPLFETLDDLTNAAEIIRTLLTNKWYRNAIDNRLMVMIGYSDSAKDAGVMAAA